MNEMAEKAQKVVPRLREFYKNEVCPALSKQFSYKNAMQVPRLEKIVVNMGLGEAIHNSKIMDAAVSELERISGQRPVITRARRSVANFKLREGMPIGCSVTLRRERMWEFFDRLITFALPRVRDFKGVSRKGFDGRGNYTLGVREQIIFPEIDYDKIDKIKGLNVTFVTSAATDEEGLELLRQLGMPFKK
jgi:large subunit ribosomal protein L5